MEFVFMQPFSTATHVEHVHTVPMISECTYWVAAKWQFFGTP